MSSVALIFTLIAGALAIGIVLFFPMRWFLTRNNPESERSPNVTAIGFLQAALVVVLMLIIAWFMEAGNKTASIVWGALVIGGNVWLCFMVKNKEGKK